MTLDQLPEILEALASLAWPLVAIYALCRFKDPITALIGRLRSVSPKGATFDADSPTEELKEEGKTIETDEKKFALLGYKVAHMAGHFWFSTGNLTTAIVEYVVAARHAKTYGNPVFVSKCLVQIIEVLERGGDVFGDIEDQLTEFCKDLPPENAVHGKKILDLLKAKKLLS